MSKINTTRVTRNAMFVAMSLVLAYLGRVSLLPVFPFLQLDFSDIPIFMVTILSGIPCGITVFFVSNILRALLFSSTAIIGIIMRSTSLIMVVFLGYCCKSDTKFFKKFLGVFFGTIFYLVIKMPISYFFWINFFVMSKDFLDSLFFSVLLPYNFFKLLITSMISIILVKSIDKKKAC